MHSKLSECTIKTLNYNSCYTLYLVVNSIAILDEKSKFTGQSVIESIVYGVKVYFSFVFKELRKWAIESFHMKLSKNNGIIDGRDAKSNQGYSLGCKPYILIV